ncbi:hypothetical protein D917_10156 [Trichinella nativa]|uniref:Uncharacterized protein n=1 Tax=Trichinella nativa TaxID=6335 RepID=A0A1Y3EGI6_9BILA|nr:hypothetical protein D917_10156 [Trichinella nativa]
MQNIGLIFLDGHFWKSKLGNTHPMNNKHMQLEF